LYALDGPQKRTKGPFLLPVADIGRELPADCLLAGQLTEPLLSGLGYGRTITVPPGFAPADFAVVVAAEAEAGGYVTWKELLPLYLRRAEAEEVWEKKHGAKHSVG
jgi:hypothetical protein